MPLFIIPLITLLITQLLKLVFSKKSYSFKDILFKYGGMPSAHSSVVTSLLILAYTQYGLHSFEVALTVIIALIVIRDAIGLRNYVGKNTQNINALIEIHNSSNPSKKLTKEAKIHVGHTLLEVCAGVLSGIIITYSILYVI